MAALFPDPCLSVADVRRITGYAQPKRQVRWFIENGYRAVLNARNECIVFRADMNERKPERPQVRLRSVA